MYTLDKLRMAILSVSLVDFCVCAHTPVLLAPDQDAEDSCPVCTPAPSIDYSNKTSHKRTSIEYIPLEWPCPSRTSSVIGGRQPRACGLETEHRI